MNKMHQGTKTLFLALLALLLTAARAFPQQRVTVVPTDGGTITASLDTAAEGETVALTVEPLQGYRLVETALVAEMIGSVTDTDHPHLSRRATPTIGAYVGLTKVAKTLYTFRMPATAVEVRAAFAPLTTVTVEATESGSTGGQGHGITLEVSTDESRGETTICGAHVPAALSATPLTIAIPATVSSGGTVYRVTAIAQDMLLGQTNVTDIVMPATAEPLHLDNHAFRIDLLPTDDASHRVATVHTPLPLLDDYALMPGLEDNFGHLKVRATAVAPNHYWTFSCGVDIILPEGLTPYYCRAALDGRVEFMGIGGRVVAANNGVLLACKDDMVASYELTAKPNAGRAGYTTPATYDAKTYPDNLLEPVIKATHYDSGEYYILYGNEFHPILSEGDEVKVPACKAVLHVE
jgi:hypothetical protein